MDGGSLCIVLRQVVVQLSCQSSQSITRYRVMSDTKEMYCVGQRMSNGCIRIEIPKGHKLQAPQLGCSIRHWLPCDRCGKVHSVQWSISSYLCSQCRLDIRARIV